MKINWFKIYLPTIQNELENLILFGNPLTWYNFLNYLKIGWNCSDCKTQFNICTCNYCNNCKFNICACSDFIFNKGDFSMNYSNNELALIRTKALQFMIKNLNKRLYKNILFEIKTWYSKHSTGLCNSENLEYILQKMELF